MPRAGKAKKPDENAVYVAWQGAAVDIDGTPHTVAAGERRLGSDPVVREHGWLFVADGTPADQWPSHHAGRPEQQERERRFKDNPYDVRVLTEPDSLTLDLVVCRKPLKVGWGRNVEGLPEHIVTLEPGELFNRDEQAVEKAAAYFEPFEPDTRPKGRRR